MKPHEQLALQLPGHYHQVGRTCNETASDRKGNVDAFGAGEQLMGWNGENERFWEQYEGGAMAGDPTAYGDQ